MGNGQHEAAGTPYRRARASAWTVFWLTAGTSVLYNCYHALVDDHMPSYTGVPEGVLPLVVAIGVLEFSGAWRENKPMQWAAWTVTGGAMAWSAIAINAVVHHGWAFGLIGDTAALAAMYFLLNGPTAAQAVARAAAREAELTAAANEERRAREEAEANAARTERDLRAAREAERQAERQANEEANAALSGRLAEANETARRVTADHRKAAGELAAVHAELTGLRAGIGTAEESRRTADQARSDQAAQSDRQVEGLRAQLDRANASAARVLTVEAERNAARAELAAARDELERANGGREEAERSAANAEAKAERLGRKLAAQDGPKAGRPARTETERGDRTEASLTPAQAREKAYAMLDENPELTGAEVGEPFGFGDRWGQKRKEEYEHRNGLRAVGEN